jgi:hypothetical protein
VVSACARVDTRKFNFFAVAYYWTHCSSEHESGYQRCATRTRMGDKSDQKSRV